MEVREVFLTSKKQALLGGVVPLCRDCGLSCAGMCQSMCEGCEDTCYGGCDTVVRIL